MAKFRGLYHQPEGNERNTQSMQEYITDSQSVEGDHVQSLRRMVQDAVSEGNWDKVNVFTAKLKMQGHSHTRIQSMLSSAMVGVEL